MIATRTFSCWYRARPLVAGPSVATACPFPLPFEANFEASKIMSRVAPGSTSAGYDELQGSGGLPARAEFRANVQDALQDRDRAEGREHVDRRREQAEVGEQDADREDHDAQRASRHSARAIHRQ